ncbi:MAG: LamG-like jellyroll fold domain-containing protein [Pseudomonadota bacterium]
MKLKWMHKTNRKESGNVLLTLFAAVAVIGTIGGSATVLMRGPLSTMSDVNQSTMTTGHVSTAAKMVMLDAENWTAGGDCDNDRVVEPRPWRTHTDPTPTGGGFIPNEIGSMKRDPWGTQLGYCAWDHGSVVTDKETVIDDNGCDGFNLLEGTNQRDYPAVAIISAGPNGTFDSTCRDWSAADLDADGEIDTGAGDALMFESGGDDIYVVYSYAEAAQELPSLWRVDTPDIWSIGIDATGTPEVVAQDDVEFTGSDVFAPTRMEMLGNLGLLLPNETQLVNCNVGTEGQMRRNMSGADPVLEICESNTWVSVSGTGSGETGSSAVGGNTSLSIIGATDGLVGYWRLDETLGTDVFDSSGNGNTGTMGGGLDAANDSRSAIYDNGLEFDGTTTNYGIDIPYDLSFNPDDYTITAWFKVDEFDAQGAYKIAGTNYTSSELFTLGVNLPENALRCRMGNTTTLQSPNDSIVPGVWYFGACVNDTDAREFQAYLNGQALGAPINTFGSTTDTQDARFAIGYLYQENSGTSGDYFNGTIDDVRFYNRALSAEEISEIYNREDFIARVNVAANVEMDDEIGQAAWSITSPSDTIDRGVGLAFKIAHDFTLDDTPSAAIVATRATTPSRADLNFQTFDGTSLKNAMTIPITDTGFFLHDVAGADFHTNMQIGEHYNGSFNNDYEYGLLATSNNYSENQMTYFGADNDDDFGTALLFSNILKLQRANENASSVTEVIRFESTPSITFFDDIKVQSTGGPAGYLSEVYSNTASDVAAFDFQRSRADTGAVKDGDLVGSMLFRGYEGGFVADGQAAIRAVVNGTVSTGDVPVDLVFGTSAAGTASTVEGMRLRSTGEVGVGLSAPEAKFHVGGRLAGDEGVLIGTDSTCAAVADSGTLSYNSGTFELCDGSAFNAFLVGVSTESYCKPIPFDFFDRDDLTANTNFETNTVMIGGISGSCTLIVESNSASMTIIQNGVDQTGGVITVSNGDRIALRMQTGVNNADYVSAYVSLGDHKDEVHFQTVGKITFATSAEYTGNLGGVLGAHAICNSHAQDAGLEGSFMAWLTSDDTDTSPDTSFRKYDGGYYLTDGTKIADNWSDLTDGTIDSNLDTDENGNAATSTSAWTNTEIDGTRTNTVDCVEWTSESGSESGQTGRTNLSNSQWTENNSELCSGDRNLYCFEQ